MARPDITYAQVELHLSANPDFPKRFGTRVRAAGGKFTEIRGSDATTRYVTVPASETDLIDELGRSYPKGKKTVAITKGHGDARTERLFDAPRTVFHWDPTASTSLSEFVRTTFERRLDSPAMFDWPAITGRWAEEDARAAAARRAHALRSEFEDLKVDVAAEALRVLDGANDLSDLKDLAKRLRAVCAEAGIDEPRPRVPDDREDDRPVHSLR